MEKGDATVYWGLTEYNNCKYGQDLHLQFAEMRPKCNVYWKILVWFMHLSVQHSFFCCGWGVEELDGILRTLIAQGSKKSFDCVSYFQRCVKVKLPPHILYTHALMLFLFFHQRIGNHFILCPILLLYCFTNWPWSWSWSCDFGS